MPNGEYSALNYMLILSASDRSGLLLCPGGWTLIVPRRVDSYCAQEGGLLLCPGGWTLSKIRNL